VGTLTVAIRRLPAAQVNDALGAAVLLGVVRSRRRTRHLGAHVGRTGAPDRTAGGWETAIIGTIGAVMVNNLPAAVLFTARQRPHPRALLLGLNPWPEPGRHRLAVGAPFAPQHL